MSRGQSQQRAILRRRTLGRCRHRNNIDNSNPDVVIIDAPETSHQRSSCLRARKNSSPCDVISIDDDDNEGDVNGTASNVDHTVRSKSFDPMPATSFPNNLDNDEIQMFVGNGDFLTNSRQTKRNCYYNQSLVSGSSGSGSPDSEGESCDSDDSDCEILDDASGHIREQWERAAALRKKMSAVNQFCCEDRVSASASNSDTRTQTHETANKRNSDPGPHLHENTDKMFSADPSANQRFSQHSDEVSSESSSSNSFNSKAGLSLDVNSGINQQQEEEMISEKFSAGSQCPNKNKLCSDGFTCSAKNKQDCVSASFYPSEVRNYAGTMDSEEPSPEKMDEIFVEHVCHVSHTASGGIVAEEKKKPCVKEKSCFINEQSDGPYTCNGPVGFQQHEDTCLGDLNDSSLLGSVSGKSLATNKEHGNAPSDVLGETENIKESTANVEMAEVKHDLIGAREKHKESAEYRRAVEEEWASRQRELQIQAEEAQRLRRRRKAESMRLLDMEKRQKQRLEEIHQLQKKNEETINLKEQLRVEVREELKIMEEKYRDMASLLRALGIHVEGGSFPLTSEVKAACKQALRKFHPDRFSKCEIHQQVPERLQLLQQEQLSVLETSSLHYILSSSIHSFA